MGSWPTARDSENDVHGRPDARFVVPSTGSQYQAGPSPASPPSSSPTTWWSGNAAATSDRTARSVATSTSVTTSAACRLVRISPSAMVRARLTASAAASRATRRAASRSTESAMPLPHGGDERTDVVADHGVDATIEDPVQHHGVVDGPAGQRYAPGHRPLTAAR